MPLAELGREYTSLYRALRLIKQDIVGVFVRIKPSMQTSKLGKANIHRSHKAEKYETKDLETDIVK
jgi:hypothetical protein